jgi:hypothetical protein
MKIGLAAILLTFVTSPSFAQCTNIVTVNSAIDADSIAGAVFITLDGQCDQVIPTIDAGDEITIVAAGKQFGADTRRVVRTDKLVRIEAVAGGPAAADDATLDQLATDATATVTLGTTSFAATIVNPNAPLLDITRYAWSLGPATKSSATASTNTNESAEGAFRLTYDGEYARPGFFGRGTGDAKFQTLATLSLDTTNSDDTGYIDNNRATLGIQSVDLPLSDLLAQSHFGIEGRVTRSLHQSAQDSDLAVTFSTWIPSLPSKTIFSTTPGFISPPLAVSLSYGFRNKDVPGAKSVSGRSGEATATYYLYAFDKYQMTLSGKWTLNDMSDRPSTIPRTQRLYKVAIAYLVNPAKGFEVQTSFESGSVGPLATKVRQYAIAIAAKKFSMAGGSK